MKEFFDKNGKKVTLSFGKESFGMRALHVLVICRFQDKWLLTKHPTRGLEFPGGKIEDGETEKRAAAREVYEETGGSVEQLLHVGEYFVEDKEKGPFVKAIFFAIIGKMDPKRDYLETDGPVLLDDAELENLQTPAFSFIMKDEVVPSALAWIEEHLLAKEGMLKDLP